ncbi:YSIRK-type signal peptide-containing protein, partial [Streptococcus suis]|nr:YSIRK-type signal peptide-containing protein [Streptococcus suis]
MSQETKQIFSIRKFKTGTHSALLAKYGLALVSSAILMGAAGAVSADEVTTPTNPTATLTANPATNLETAQAAPSEANQATAQSSGTQTGTLTNEVTSDSLNTAVSAAQDAGVTVSKEASVTHDSLSTAQADLASQETSVKEVTAKAEANTKAISDAKATNAQIDAENQAEKERVDALNKAKQAEVDQYNAAEKARVEALNKAKEAEVNAEKARVDVQNKAGQAEVDAYNQAEKERVDALNAAKKEEIDAYNKAQEAEYTAKKAEYDKQVAEFDNINSQAKGSLPAASNGYTPSGSTTHLKAQSIGGLEFVSTGDLKNPTVYIKGAIDPSKVISSLSWGNVAPEGPGLTKGTYGNPGYYWTGAYNYNTNGTTTQIWTGEVLKWYKIKDAITMLDGSKHDAYIQFQTDTSGLYHESAETKTDGKHVVFWNESGAINSLDGFRQGGANPESDAVRLTVRVDSPTNDTSYTWLNVMYDIDGGQFMDYDKETTKVLAVGGGMTTNTATSGRAAADEDLGYTYGVHRSSNALDGRASSPDGTILYVTQGAQYSTVLRNTAGGNGSVVARADFGADARITIKPAVTPPPVEPKTYTPESPTLREYTPITTDAHYTPETPTLKTYTPVTPTVKPHVAVPKKESFSVAVHPVFVTQTPTNVKDVVDTDTVSTNGHLVPKGSIQTWTLTNEGLKAGRDRVTSFVMTDPLPSGFVIDRDATVKANADAWTVAYKEDGKLELVATDSTLAALNA